MTSDAILEAVSIINPGALARARRLALAVTLVRSGMHRRDVVQLVRQRHQCSRIEAYRVVSWAIDLAEPQQAKAAA